MRIQTGASPEIPSDGNANAVDAAVMQLELAAIILKLLGHAEQDVSDGNDMLKNVK